MDNDERGQGMTDVILHSHGSWDPSKGYFQLPKGCSVRFFTHFAKTLMPTDAKKIIDGSYGGPIEREVGEYKTIPNMGASPLSNSQLIKAQGWLNGGTRGGVAFYSTPVRRTLSELVELTRNALGRDGTYRFDWVCCQALKLEKTPLGGTVGVNARHYAEKGEFMFVDRFGGGKKYLGKHKSDSVL